MRSELIRVTRQQPCQICKKTDWCSYSADGKFAICMRIESKIRTKNNGYLHQLNDDWKPTNHRVVQRKPTKPKMDCEPLHRRCRSALTDEALGWLANDLGLSVEVVERFEIGFHPDKNVYSMPARRPNGSICGLKYRAHSGSKFFETGLKPGLFFVPNSLVRDYLLIVEGCSDAMAVHDLAYPSVIGRDSCNGSVEHIRTLLRRLKPRQVIIIPDNDSNGAGQRGAEALAHVLKIHHKVNILNLPDKINDVRDAVQRKESADWLQDRIGRFITKERSRKDSTNE